MRVLVACEFSGVVREAFRARGHDAWSCDLLSSEDESPFHLIGDAVEIACDKALLWDLMIAHPPCTYLTNAGVRHLYDHVVIRNGKRAAVYGEARFAAMRESAAFFNLLQNCDIPRICVENPIPHHYARDIIGKYTQIIQPWQFGHGETKATCLWLKGLSKLVPTDIVEGRTPRVHYASPGPDRWKVRSRTLTGIAAAMADQWGSP